MATTGENLPLNQTDIETHVDDNGTKESSSYMIDKGMLPSKFAYIFQQVKDSCYLPNMNLFLISTGLNAI